MRYMAGVRGGGGGKRLRREHGIPEQNAAFRPPKHVRRQQSAASLFLSVCSKFDRANNFRIRLIYSEEGREVSTEGAQN